MLMIILIVVSVVLYLYLYRIVDIDDHQRIALEYPETGQLLKVKVPYEQVRPHKSSHLHEPQTVDSSATFSLDDAIALQAKGVPQNEVQSRRKKSTEQLNELQMSLWCHKLKQRRERLDTWPSASMHS